MPRYIDADAKIEQIKNIRLEKQHAGICYEGDFADIIFNIIINHIKNAPTADVQEVKHGKWVWYKDACGGRECVCNVCKGELPSTHTGGTKEYISETDYCPNCGAKMKGEKSNEN